MLGRLKDKFAKGSGSTVEDIAVCLARVGHLEVVHRGTMSKKGKLNKGWRTRYFLLLAPGYLVYLEDSKPVDALLEIKVVTGYAADPEQIRKAAEAAVALGVKGSVQLTPATAVRRIGRMDERDNVWSIRAPLPSQREFFFSSPSSDNADTWEERIRGMDAWEEEQRRLDEEREAKAAEERTERIKDKYRALLPACKDPYVGGTAQCGDSVWTYTSGGPGEGNAAVLEAIEGPHAGLQYVWNGTVISDGQVALMGDDKGGWGLWNGRRMEWRTPACLDRRGRGQAWEYRVSADWRVFTANEFTKRMGFPHTWTFDGDNCLRPSEHGKGDDVGSVVVDGSVPPMIALACGMYRASRREAVYQTKILREIQAEAREKRLLKEAMVEGATSGHV